MTITEAARGVGDRAPDLPLTSAEGDGVQLSSLWGEQPIALAFFRPLQSEFCVDNALQLRDAHENMRRAGGEIVAVCAARWPAARSFRERWQLPYPLLVVDDDAYEQFAVSPGEPGSFVVDGKGVIHFAHRCQGRTDNPSSWSLIDVVCSLTGKRVEPPVLSSLSSDPDGSPHGAEASLNGDGPLPKYTCVKCGHDECEVLDVSSSKGGMFSRMFNSQHRGFSAVSCGRCRYIEFYKAEPRELRNIFNLIANS